jgi:poly(3-hydroxybutyrate) depolymerase
MEPTVLPTMRTTLAELTRRRRAWSSLMSGAAEHGDGRLTEVAVFGANPGDLRMLRFVPKNLPPGAPLVVLLHGCTQTAGGFDAGTGWSVLAERYRFALLVPEQRRANNGLAGYLSRPVHRRRHHRRPAVSLRDRSARSHNGHVSLSGSSRPRLG